MDIPKLLRPFSWHGVKFEIESGNDLIADCPFCGKRTALAVSTKTGMWSCHSSPDTCGRKGNIPSFFDQLWEVLVETTSKKSYEMLAVDRGIPASALENECAFHAELNRWVIPTRKLNGRIHDLRAWKRKPGNRNKRQLLATANVPGGTALWGMEQLDPARLNGKKVRVWVCEGEWDGLALKWLLAVMGLDDVVVAVPGARVIKPEWTEAIAVVASEVIVCPDLDADGDLMAEKWWKVIKPLRLPIKWLLWPHSLPEKSDVRDFISRRLRKETSVKSIYESIESLVDDKHPKMMDWLQSDPVAGAAATYTSQRRTTGPRPKLKPVYEAFSRWLKMTPDLFMALRAALATNIAGPWAGDPLWLFIVGPPASGKSEILMSMDGAPGTVYQSSVTRESLISGFQGAKDASLIPRIIGNCGVFKDWTEMLEAHPTEQAKAYSCLRGFYDGRVDKTFGNGKSCDYRGTGGILAGVTNDIYRVGKASLGERFLKFQVPRPRRLVRNAIIEAAILNVTREKEKDMDIRDAVKKFLDFERQPLSPEEAIPKKVRNRLYALTELIAILRQSVDWGGSGSMREREVAVRPDPEMPTRLAKQLSRLAIADLVVRGKQVIDADAWRLVERVAFNTANGFNLDVVEAMMMLDGTDLEYPDICSAARMHRNTLDRRMEGLEVLGIVQKTRVSKKGMGMRGGPSARLSVAPYIRKLWAIASPNDWHMDSAIDARLDTD